MLIFLVSLLGPLVVMLFELLIRRLFGERPRIAVHGVVIGALLSLIIWNWLLDQDSPGVLRNLLPLVLTAAIAWLYVKTELIRNFAQILSLAAVVVIVVFAIDYPIKDEVLPHESKTDTPKIESETPVVIVVFDELPLASLARPDGSIDPRFPTFAMLARDSTWYPGAVSLADQTLHAMPSILSGTDPDGSSGVTPTPPGVARYPDSICRIAEDGGYTVHAYEPITDLCERSWGLGTRVTATIRRALGVDQPGSETDLLPTQLDQRAARALNSPFEVPYTEIGEGRREAFDEFIAGLPAERRSLSLMHSTLPHVYWMYLPDGRTYPSFRPPGSSQLISPPTQPEVNRDAQQMMIQLEFTDRKLGKLVRKMKENGTWEESLFIVTADHGAAFQKGGSRRMVNVFNSGWIVPVPLFVKFPGQKRGRIVNGTVDGRDIATTVMGEFGLDPLDGMKGRDLAGKSRLPRRKTIEVNSVLEGPSDMEVAPIQRNERIARRYMHELLGESFYATGGQADLLGRRPTGLTEVPATPRDPSLYEDVDTASDELPAYYEAQLSPPGKELPGALAIALNGRIVATSRAWPVWGVPFTGAILPPDRFRDGNNEIKVYEIDPRRGDG